MYNCVKSISKTATKNNLIKADNKRLFDFSILNGCDIDTKIKDIIINQSIPQCKFCGNNFSFIFYKFSDCESISAKLFFKEYQVENDYNRLYRIYRAVKIEYYHREENLWEGTSKFINQFEKMTENNYRPEYIKIWEN